MMNFIFFSLAMINDNYIITYSKKQHPMLAVGVIE